MSRPSVGIRLDVLGKREVIAALRDTGREGQRMADKIEKASPPASKGLLAIDEAAKQARGGLDGLAKRSGGLGSVLGKLGRTGNVAAIGIGAIAAAGVGVYATVRRVTGEVAAIGDEADRLGITAEAMQRIRAATLTVNVEAETAADLMGELSGRAYEAAEGAGSAAEAFTRLGVEVRRPDGSIKSLNELLPDLADGFQRLEDPMARVSLAGELFSDQGRELIPLLVQGGDAFRALGDQAAATGRIIGEDSVRGAQAANIEFERQADLINTALRKAFVDLGPAITELIPYVSAFISKVSEGIMRVLDLFGVIDRRRLQDLQPQVAALELRRAEILEQRSQMDSLISNGVVPSETYMRNGDATALENLQENTAELAAVENQLGSLRNEIRRLQDPTDVPGRAGIPPDNGGDDNDTDYDNDTGGGGGGSPRAPGPSVDPNAAIVTTMDRIWANVEEAIELERDRMDATRDANEALRDLVDDGVGDLSRGAAEAAFGLRDFNDVLKDVLLDIARDLPALLTGGAVTTGAGGIVQDLLGGVGQGIVRDGGGTIGDWIAGLLPGFADGGSFDVSDRSSPMRIPARGGDDRLVAFRAQVGERVSVSRRGQSAGGGTINQTIVIEGDATDATIERMRAAMREEIAMARPGIVQQSVVATGAELQMNPDFAR